jgi:exopolysaccharide production protein ExoQ
MNRPLTMRAQRLQTRANPPTESRAPAPSQGGYVTAFLVWVLVIYLVVPIQYLSGDVNLTTDASMGAANPLARTIKLGLLLLSTGVVLSKSGLALLEMRALNRGFLAFLVLVPLSAAWSIDPGATINRYISILSIVDVCLAFTVMGWGRRRFQDVLRPVVTILLVGSVLWSTVYPQYGVEVGEGTLLNSWRGLTAQKNQFGMLASIGVVLWLHAWFSKEKRVFVVLPFLLLSFACVLLSRSSTSLMATTLSTFFMALVMVAPPSLRRYMPYIVSVFATVVVVYALAVLNIIPGSHLLLDPIAALSGKDMTFSNRAVIWDIIKEHIAYAPALGSGYGAYWTGPLPSSPSFTFLSRMYFYPSQSHNGYLEIVNDLGFVGLMVLLAYLYYWVSQALKLMKFDRNQGMLFLALFFQQAITNLSESTWLAINSAFAIAVATLATFALSRALLEQRLAQHFRTSGARRPRALS